jgi:DNA topoisomerase-1
LNRAVTILAEAKPSGGREVGTHPDDGKPIKVQKGRFGPYVKHGKTNATLPRDLEMDDITLEQALALIAAKIAKTGAKAAKPKAEPKPKAKAKAKPKAKKKAAAKAKSKTPKKAAADDSTPDGALTDA